MNWTCFTCHYIAARKEATRDLFNNVLDSINIAKEIADGLRVIFDFNLSTILLYRNHGEAKQYNEVMKPGRVLQKRLRPPASTASENLSSKSFLSRRRSTSDLPSMNCESESTSSSTSDFKSHECTSAAPPTSPQAIQLLRELQDWRLVPDAIYENKQKKPLESMIYGPIHFLRLFVKLPDILGKMAMPVKTKKLVVKYMDSVLDYLQTHQDLFLSQTR